MDDEMKKDLFALCVIRYIRLQIIKIRKLRFCKNLWDVRRWRIFEHSPMWTGV